MEHRYIVKSNDDIFLLAGDVFPSDASYQITSLGRGYYLLVSSKRANLRRAREIFPIFEPDRSGEVVGVQTRKAPPRFKGGQWNLTAINAREAWSISTGEGVVISFPEGVDYTHLDLGGSGGLDLSASDDPQTFLRKVKDDLEKINSGAHPKILGGESIIQSPFGCFDDFRHGTYTASVAAACGCNGFFGAAPHAKLLPLKIVDGNGRALMSDLIAAVLKAIGRSDVMYISLAFPYMSAALDDVLAEAEREGLLVIAAAGNNGRNLKMYPASSPHVLCVGGSGASGEKWEKSNYGDHVDIYAPASPMPVCLHYRSRYTIAVGTSLSAPAVAGVAALVMSVFKSRKASYDINDIKSILLDSCNTATKVIDAYSAVRKAGSYASLRIKPTSIVRPKPKRKPSVWHRLKMWVLRIFRLI